MTDRDLINQLKTRRKQLGLTQTEIARRIHLTPNAISQLEKRGQTQLATFIQYATAVGMKITLTDAKGAAE